MAVVIYAPSLALEAVSGVPKEGTIIVTGLVCTFYTTLGGMKAVIWTDVFQASIMVAGMFYSRVEIFNVPQNSNWCIDHSFHCFNRIERCCSNLNIFRVR